jgi:hypothetical protein
MPNEKTDRQGFSTENADQERDIAGKGGPSVGAGVPDSKHAVPRPSDEDTQTKLAAASTQKKDNTKNKLRNEDEE